VIAGVGFVFAVAAVSATRNKRSGVRLFDWAAMAAVAVTPQIMLLVVEFDGLLQRVMVLVGYIWLIVESTRVQAVSGHLYRPQATRRSSTPTSR
jgi:hypothetical protein